MIKLSRERALTARHAGVARALYDMGYSPEAIKIAFEEQGIEKEAFWNLLKPLASIGPRALKYLARLGGEASGALGTAVEGMKAAPTATLWGGTKNFGKGLLGGGEGVGGAAGKGTLYSSMFSDLMRGPAPRRPYKPFTPNGGY